jgi:hypothetical protein
MSQFDAAPPNTHAGGNDDALRTKGNDPLNAPPVYEVADERMNMEEYAKNVPLWKRVWQNSLTQMLLLSVQAFCGPAMADAIAGKQDFVEMRASELTCNRTRWRWSCYSSNVQYRYRCQLHYACCLLCAWRSHRQ